MATKPVDPADTDTRFIIANPDEPRAGDYAYSFYDKAHPFFGEHSTQLSLRKQLRGLRGKRVTAQFKMARIDDEGTTRRFSVRRTFVLSKYTDLFGAGSALSSALHSVREKHSDETLVIYSILIEVL